MLFNDLSRWHSLGEVEEHLHLYTVRAHHQGLQRVVRVVLLLCDKVPGKPRYVLLFSSDVEQNAMDVYRFYRARFSYSRARFQMEFLFRDAKQWTGLSDCQARDEKALHFHFNAALSAVNLVKVQEQQHGQCRRKSHNFVFSLASCKQRCYNEHLLDTIIQNLELEPSWVKAHPCYKSLCNYGAIAA